MKKFKQFLEENLIRGVFREDVSIHPYYPNLNNNPLNPNPPVNQQPGGIGLWYGPDNRPGPTIDRSPFLIYDSFGNVVGTDFNGDGEADTPEQLDQWRQTGLPPSDWLVDQPWYERWRILTWEIAPWVLPFGGWAKVLGLASKLHNILNTILYHGSIALDAWDIMKLIEALFTGNFANLPQELLNIQQAIEAERQNLLNWLIENGLSSLIDSLSDIWLLYQGTFTETPGSIPKMFYRFVPGTYVDWGTGGVDWDKVRIQLWRFNPATGTWEPFGPPMTWEEYANHCGTPGSNCAPLDNGSIPFYPPLPRPLKQTLEPQTQTNEPMDQRPTNNHWNQQAPGGGSVGNGSNQPPNPNIFQM